MDNQDFRRILTENWPTLATESAERVVAFRNLVVSESSRQNLTKLLSPADFYYGHVLDVQKFLEWGSYDMPAVDLGSGCGVPGLLAALISGGSWVLAESEGRKAAFLQETAHTLGLAGRVRVHSGRLESWLKAEKAPVGSIVARAVGPVDRIFSWIRECSTWNSLVLFKGPGWSEEWASFESGPHKGELQVSRAHAYLAGPESKQRVLVRLERVPRGTRPK
jgi:16S rRNA (guanine527-N7)-methyltransferase